MNRARKWIRSKIEYQEQRLQEASCKNPKFSEDRTVSVHELHLNTLQCFVCSSPVHFIKSYIGDATCDLCGVFASEERKHTVGELGVVWLQCSNCSLSTCAEVSDSCYDAYFNNQKWKAELYSPRKAEPRDWEPRERRRWLRCLCMDIEHERYQFTNELHAKLQVENLSDCDSILLRKVIGIELARRLVRCLVIMHSSLPERTKAWLKEVIANADGAFDEVAMTASVASDLSFEIFEWFLGVVTLETALINTLKKASYKGHLEVVSRLLEDERVDPSVGDNYAIQWASRNGHLKVVERLLEDERVDPSVDDNYAIRWASRNGNLKVVERLLEDERVDPSASTWFGNNAIRWASENGHLEVVNRLMEDERIDPSDSAWFGNNAIGLASANGHLKVVNRLLENEKVDPFSIENYAIRQASKNGHLEVVNRLLEDERVDPSADNNYAIRWASCEGYLEILNRLLEDERVNLWAVLKEASKGGHLNVVNGILEHGRVDPSADYSYALQRASVNGHVEVVSRFLEDKRVDPSVDDNYVIRQASRSGHLKVVNRLLQDARVDPSAQDNFAIRWASYFGHLEVVNRLLQDARVDPSANEYEALVKANHRSILATLYFRVQKSICFYAGQRDLLCRIEVLHFESRLIGAWCLQHIQTSSSSILPDDLIREIVSNWTAVLEHKY